MVQEMIVAIYGKSCTGKTTVAKSLAKAVNAEIRCCSEEVKNRANQLKCSTIQLSAEEHNAIDQKTREIASLVDSDLVIEGSFLHYVLIGISNVFWIELTCDDYVRRQRHQGRQCLTHASLDLNERDFYDEFLCQKLYKKTSLHSIEVVEIDSTNKSIEEIVTLITTAINNSNVNKA